jgi:branched-chain amino acid transport system ATP-binding protein
MAEALRLEGVALAFGGLAVLRGVSFELAPGELLALIGPNGAGKTSVLNCVSGIYRPSGGRILFEGREITGWRPSAVARCSIARTFQHGELFPHLTVLDNVMVGRHRLMRTHLLAEGVFARGVRAAEVEHRAAVEEILDAVELQRYRHRLVAALPFGIQKIVGFARALAMAPRLLLLDEPSAGLNREEKEDLARFILRIKHELGIAMLWVEHDMQMVADLADRIYVLNYGEYVTDGPPGAVLSDPRVAGIYLGKRGVHGADVSRGAPGTG